MSYPLIALIQDLREHLTDLILASPEDAEYFRALYRKKPPVEVLKPVTKQSPPPLIPKVVVKPATPPPAPLPLSPPPPLPKQQHPSFLVSLFGKIAPDFPILKEIPSDEKARKIANRWKTKNQSAPISVLSFSEPPEHKLLLEQIAKAIDVFFGPAKIVSVESIEKEKQWEAFLSVADLKLILCCDYTLWQMGDLMRHFKEIPATGTRHLGKVPLFLLPDLSLYLKDPLLKRSLWKALCQTIRCL